MRSTDGAQNVTAQWMSLKMTFMSFSAPCPAHKQKQTDGVVWCDAVPAIPSHEVSVKTRCYKKMDVNIHAEELAHLSDSRIRR